MQKVALRLDGVHRVLSLDAYLSREAMKEKGESTCQDYLITHGIKSWLLSQSPPPSRSEKGKLSPGEWRFGDLEEPWGPLLSKDSRVVTVLLPNRKTSSKFPIDLSSNITIFF